MSQCRQPGEAPVGFGGGKPPPCPAPSCIDPPTFLPTVSRILLASDTHHWHTRMETCPSRSSDPTRALPPALACVACPASVSPSA